MKLKTALRRRSTGELLKIAESWKVELNGHGEDTGCDVLVEHLYPRLQSKTHFQHLWDTLPEGRQRLATFLAIHGGDMGLRELARRCFGGDERDARRGLVPLVESGLVFRDSETSNLVSDEIYGIPDLLVRHIPIYAHYRGYLGQYLQEMSLDDLERLATQGMGLPIKAPKRDYLRYAIRRTLLKPSTLRSQLERLQPGERELFHTVIRRGGLCIYGDLIDLGYQRHADHSKVDLLNSLLKTTGVLFIQAKGENKYADLLRVPKDIVHLVRSGWREDLRSLSQLDTATGGGRHAPSVVLDSGTQVLRDLVVFISQIRKEGARCLTRGGIGKNDLKRIFPMLSPGKSIKFARFLGIVATELGLLESVGNRWQVSEKAEKWIENPVKAYADLVQFWAGTPAWNEEYAEGDVAHADQIIPNLINIAEVRRLVLESLTQLPHGEWVEFKAFANVLLPKVALAVPRRAGAASGKFNRPPFYIAESIVVDSLHWLGVVAIGSDSRDHLESVLKRGNLPVGGPRRRLRKRLHTVEDTHLLFRVTDLGNEALKLLTGNGKSELADHDPLQFKTEKFTVQPNHEILTPPDLSLPIFHDLLSFSDVRSMDVMATLVVNQSSVRHGLEIGMEPETMQEVLREGSATPVPQTIEHMISECATEPEGLCVGVGGGYLEVEDEVLMAEIQSSRRLKSLIREIIANRVVIFHPHASLDRVVQEIERLGHSVKLDGGAAVRNEAGKMSVALSERDVMLTLAALRFTADLEREMGIDLSEGRLRTLERKLEPSGPRHAALLEYAETLGKKFVKRHAQAIKRRVEEATERHRAQVEKLLDRPVSRPSGKHAYSGANPATSEADVRDLVDFAIEHELAVELKRTHSDKSETVETLTPESVEGDRIYAFNGTKDSHTLVRFDRILEARLL